MKLIISEKHYNYLTEDLSDITAKVLAQETPYSEQIIKNVSNYFWTSPEFNTLKWDAMIKKMEDTKWLSSRIFLDIYKNPITYSYAIRNLYKFTKNPNVSLKIPFPKPDKYLELLNFKFPPSKSLLNSLLLNLEWNKGNFQSKDFQTDLKITSEQLVKRNPNISNEDILNIVYAYSADIKKFLEQ